MNGHAPSDAGERGALARRRFLAGVGLGALGAAAGLGAARTAADTAAASPARRWGLVVDAERCASGCDACVRGCDEENGITGHDRPRTDARWIRKVTLRNRSTGRVTSLPLMCQHCEHPPCVDVCPTGASFRRADGVVLVDKHTCIGCRYCMMACPYKARSFIHEPLHDQRPWAPRGKGTVESCTLCVQRIDEGAGREPACAEACRAAGHAAITFGDLADRESDASREAAGPGTARLREDLELDTAVFYRSL